MPSTLTTGVKDGKQSKKIEINLLKRKIFEILFCKVGGWFDLIAQTFEPAQSLQ
ncbi:hypothetical protein SAMN04489802_1260 [Pseudomonas chlororaphis]|nr:hypothetical protein C4K20_5078 [Pseudomonas chlororaphis subsp. aurantiaca]AZD69139.1 hypothetical protein C4K17_5276 [Pseudomonas chlororaphis subsp. aurantiaca]AZD75336.1 hypothetical protein C4K16_4999 [Pseudomonas chlororaphis subsp. aurantiaca]AZD81589.1 hypothetical protein C4K15_5045 [Pseudomonas chlororaphis subsp. aurantiaca]SDS36493.1 hypothetical protein SAMN04489802_1260 [Pseudomonas chlororaphis]